jgi:hypothetical protein
MVLWRVLGVLARYLSVRSEHTHTHTHTHTHSCAHTHKTHISYDMQIWSQMTWCHSHICCYMYLEVCYSQIWCFIERFAIHMFGVTREGNRIIECDIQYSILFCNSHSPAVSSHHPPPSHLFSPHVPHLAYSCRAVTFGVCATVCVFACVRTYVHARACVCVWYVCVCVHALVSARACVCERMRALVCACVCMCGDSCCSGGGAVWRYTWSRSLLHTLIGYQRVTIRWSPHRERCCSTSRLGWGSAFL